MGRSGGRFHWGDIARAMSFLASVHLTIYVTLPSSRAEIRIQQTGGPHLHVYGINRRLPHFHLYRSFYGVATAQFEIHTPYAQPGDWNDLIPRAHLREAGATVGQLEMHPISDTRGRITISFQPVDTGPDGLRKLLEDLIESVVQDDFLPGTRQDDWVVAVSRFHHEFFPRDPVATPLLVRDSPLPPNSDASNSGSAPSEENSMERSYRVWEESTRIFARCTKMDDRFRPLGEPVKFSSTVKLFKKDLKQLTKLSKQISEGSYLYCFIQGEMTHLNGIAQSENTWLRTGVQGFQQRAAAGDCILSLDASLYCNTNGIIVPLDLKRAGSLANHLGGIFPLGPGYLDFQRKFFQLNANIPEEMSHVPRHEDLEIPDSEVPALTEKLNQSFHRIDQLLSIGLPHSPAFLLQLGMKNFNFLTLLTNTNQEIAPIHSLRTSYLLHQTIQQLSELPVPDTEDQARIARGSFF